MSRLSIFQKNGYNWVYVLNLDAARDWIPYVSQAAARHLAKFPWPSLEAYSSVRSISWSRPGGPLGAPQGKTWGKPTKITVKPRETGSFEYFLDLS